MSITTLRALARAFDKSPFSPHGLGTRAASRLAARRRAAAQSQREWVAIEERRGPAGQVLLSENLSLDDWDRQHAIERELVPVGTATRLLLTLRNVKVAPVVLWAETAIARVRHGWAPEDTWSLDWHLCHTLGDMLIHLADNTHGWPHSPTYPEFGDWRDALRNNGAALRGYNPDDEHGVEEARSAIRWVADHLDDLWD